MNERRVSKREATIPELDRRISARKPVVDIFENDNEILLHADMPGVEKDNIFVNIKNGQLEITGRRTIDIKGAPVWVEFGDVQFRRSFSVPQTIDMEKVSAELKDGVLYLHLSKSEAAKPRQIEIKTA